MGMLINYCKKNDSLSAESLVLGKLAHHLFLQSTFLVCIFVCIIVCETSHSGVGIMIHNVGGVKCQPFLKHSSYKTGTISREAFALVTAFADAVAITTAKESLCSTQTWSTTSSCIRIQL